MELQLTKSQERVVIYKAKGFLEKQICDKLFISIHTVKWHVKTALKNNRLTNGFELVARYAATHPEIFKTAIAVVFIAIQGFTIVNNHDIDLRRAKRTNRIVRIVKTNRI